MFSAIVAAELTAPDDVESEAPRARTVASPVEPKPSRRPRPSKGSAAQPASAKKKPAPVVLSGRVSPGGLLLSVPVLRSALSPEQIRMLRGRLTTTRIERLGTRTLSTEQRFYYRELTLKDDTGAETPFYAFARWCALSEHLLDFNPSARLALRCNIPRGLPVAWDLLGDEALFPNQLVILDHLMACVYSQESLAEGLAGCILVADTGFGKTYTSLALARRLGRKTLVVMPNTNNMDEWARVLSERYAVRVGFFYGAHKRDGDVVLTTIQSIVKPRFKFSDRGEIAADLYFREFGLVIYDEVHNYATATRHEIFWRLNTRAVLGLTATPDERADRLDEVYHRFVGPEVVAADLPGYAPDEIVWDGLVRVIRYHGPPAYTEHKVNAEGWANSLEMNRQCARDPFRTAILLSYVDRLVREGRNVFVFAEHRGYLDRLYLLMQGSFSVEYPERQVTKLVGGQKPAESALGRTGAVILITYGFGSESLSLPRMDALVFASPRRAKCKQTVGRILRRGGDPSIRRLIYDFVDAELSISKQYSSRKKVYTAKGFEIREIELVFADYAHLVEEYETGIPIEEPDDSMYE